MSLRFDNFARMSLPLLDHLPAVPRHCDLSTVHVFHLSITELPA